MSRGIVAQPVSGGGVPRAALPALALAALVALVVAVPVALVVVGGWPLSHVGLGQFSRVISSHRSDDPRLAAHWLARGALLLVWCSWAWMTVCVALECRAWATGGAPTRLPASRTMQSVVACLVGTALAMSAASRGASVPPAPVAHAASTAGRTATAVRVIEEIPGLDPVPGADRLWSPLPSATRPGGPPVPGDASGPRWAPYGDGGARAGSEGDGSADDARDGDAEDRMVTTRSARSHVVTPRETLWSIATDRLGSSLRWRELARLNYGVAQPDGDALTHEHWIRPGWSLELPPADPDPAPTVSGGRDPEAATGPDGAMDSVGVTGPAGATDSAGVTHWRSHVPVTPLGGGIVGAGVVSILDRMRRVQQRHRRSGTLIRMPGGVHGAIEGRLRAGEGWVACSDVDRSLRLLGHAWREHGSAPVVQGVTVRPDVIDVMMDGTATGPQLPDGCTIGPDGRSVLVDRASLSGPTARGRSVPGSRTPAPLLVTAGPGVEGLVMVNAESLGSLVVRGEPTAAEAVVRALALELATSYWAGQFDLVLVGFGAELERFDRVTAVSDLTSLVHRLWLRRIRGDEQLRAAAQPSFAQARARDASERWDPVVVVCGPSTPESEVDGLVDVAADARLGSAVVVTGERQDATHEVRLSGTEPAASLELLQSVVAPQRIEVEELAEIDVLLHTASARQSVLSSEEPYVRLPVRLPVPSEEGLAVGAGRPQDRVGPRVTAGAPASRGVVSGDGDGPGQWTVEVAVLGPVEVRGQPGRSPGPGRRSWWSIWPCIPTGRPTRHGRRRSGPTG